MYVKRCVEQFEQTNKTKYFSDFKEFLFESSVEDFCDVSTLFFPHGDNWCTFYPFMYVFQESVGKIHRLARTAVIFGHYFVEIKTFHSYCFDLLGRIGNLEESRNVVSNAAEMICQGEVEPNKIGKTVLVIDEAQDMGASGAVRVSHLQVAKVRPVCGPIRVSFHYLGRLRLQCNVNPYRK